MHAHEIVRVAVDVVYSTFAVEKQHAKHVIDHAAQHDLARGLVPAEQ